MNRKRTWWARSFGIIWNVVSIAFLVACFVIAASTVVVLVHDSTSDRHRGRPEMPEIRGVMTMEQARDALAKFGEVEMRHYPDGAWRVWMSGARTKIERGFFSAVWNGDRYVADRQCLQFTFLADGSEPKLSQRAFLENIEQGGSPDCPSMISDDRLRQDHAPFDRTNEYLRTYSPRTEVLTEYGHMVKMALDPDAVAYQVTEPSKSSRPLVERFAPPDGWSLDPITPIAVDVIPPPPPFTTSADWGKSNPVKNPVGWRVIAPQGERPKVCLIWIRAVPGVQPSCE